MITIKILQKNFQLPSKEKSEAKLEKKHCREGKIKKMKRLLKLKKKKKHINRLMDTSLITTVQGICTKNYSVQKMQEMRIKYIQSKKY